jgi:GTP-binding protein Era
VSDQALVLSPSTLQVHAEAAWEQSSSGLATALAQHLTIAFLGSASSGKDSAIRALFGVDFGEISPIPGSTDKLRVVPLDKEGSVLLVNAPGFGDIRQEVDAVARKVMDSLDIIVYVVNCEGGATIDERRDLDNIRELGRPVLVCLNKIDLIRPKQRQEFIDATLAQLGIAWNMAVICAFDPLPQLQQEPIGVVEVGAWITNNLEASGKDLLFAKYLRGKAAACEPLIEKAARHAAMAGAIPIPGADLAAVTAIQIKLIRDIAAVHEVDIDRDVAVFLISQLLSGGMRGFVRWGTEAMKAAGWVPGGQLIEVAILGLSAAIAGGTTYGVGKAAIAWFQSEGKLDTEKLREIFDTAAFAYKKLKD